MDEFTCCAVCSRTALIGEQVTVIVGEGRESPVCDLCLERPRASGLGEPLRRERIRSVAGGQSVQRIWPVPAGAALRPELAATR
jgi:hypothetical protein